jgi:cysteine-rich repeat protein
VKNLKTLAACLPLFLVTACSGVDYYVANNNNNGNGNGDPVCGDGHVDPGEQCDDGEQNSDTFPDACRSDCREPYCGDGVIDGNEECDSDNRNGAICSDFGTFTHGNLGCNQDTCEFDMSECATCGDGAAEGVEEDPHYEVCDGTDLRGQDCVSIGQAQGTLSCSSACGWDISGCTGTSPICGNGVVEGMEECDDGNQNVNDACPDGPAGTCLNAYCGDGYTQTGVEGCDDGNGNNTDSCPDGAGGTCETATCGDGHIWSGQENCDTATDPSCHDCTAFCGDGNVDPLYEECDGSVSCSSDCQSYCGDGVQDPGELCDEGTNSSPYDGQPADLGNYTGGRGPTCWSDCTVRGCGDGICDATLTSVVETVCDCPQDCATTQWECDPVDDCTCPAGQGCGFNLTMNGSACRVAGTTPAGGSCSNDMQCQGGLYCGGNPGVCYKLCWDTLDCNFGAGEWCWVSSGVFGPGGHEVGTCQN